MTHGSYISGTGHIALFLWLLVGGLFASDPLPPPDVADVSLISSGEFAALSAPQPSPDAAPEVPEAPVIDASPVPPPRPLSAPGQAEVPDAVPPDTPDTLPEVPNVPNVPTDRQDGEEPPASPEEATTEFVTEAEKPTPSAPRATPGPVARPPRPRTAEAPESPQPDAAPASPPAPAGPPLSGSEKEGLRVAVQQCWNVGSLSTDVLAVTVVVAVSMARDGRPDRASIRMLGSSGGSDAAAKQAFEAAKRAIIRCGVTGYELPVEKYEQWRDIEITFNPERMRIK